MEILAVFLILIFILFWIVSFWFFFILKRQNNKKILNIYYSDLSKYQIKDLYKLFFQFKKENKFLEEEIFNDLEDTIKNLNYVSFNKLKIFYQELEKENKLKFYFNKKVFKQKILKLDKLQFDYKITYAKVKFRINELNLINEIKENLIFEVSEIFTNFFNLVKNSIDQKKLREQKYLEQIQKINLKIKNLAIKKIDLDDFIQKIKLINQEIKDANEDFNFYLDIKKYLDFEYKKILSDLRKLINNKNIPLFYLKESKKIYSNIQYEFAKLKTYFLNFNFKKAKKINTKIVNDINFLYFNTKIIINKFKFMKKITENIRLFIDNNNDYKDFIRYKFSLFIEEDKINIKNLINLEIKIIKEFGEYENIEKEEKNNIFENKYQKIILIYEDLKTYQKIFLSESVLEKKDQDFLKLNFIFNKIEDLLIDFPNNFQIKYHEKLIEAKKNFKFILNQNKNFKDKAFKNFYLKFEEKIITLYQQIFKDAFLIFYLNEIIFILNKYRFDKKIVFLKEKIESFYQEDNLIEALRIAYKTIISYRINR